MGEKEDSASMADVSSVVKGKMVVQAAYISPEVLASGCSLVIFYKTSNILSREVMFYYSIFSLNICGLIRG